MRMSKLVAGLSLALVAIGAYAADNSCNGQPIAQAVEPPPSFEAPNYSADENAAEEQAMEAQLSTWRTYATSVHDALAKTSDPRDWALATLADVMRIAPDMEDNASVDSASLIQRAVATAPGDLVVQWIGVTSNAASAGTAKAALKNLERIEPQNGAHWLRSLDEAKKLNSENDFDTVLARIGASHDFDNHFADIVAAMANVYRRFPPPANLMDDDVSEMKGDTPLVMSMATAGGVSMGHVMVQSLINGCRTGTVPEKTDTRRTDCANIGHLMFVHGTDLLSQRFGAVILRVSATFNDDDLRAERQFDWVQKSFSQLEEKSEPAALSELKLFTQTKNETEAMRQALAAAGISLVPPDDWVDSMSSFSAERLEADKTYLRSHADLH